MIAGFLAQVGKGMVHFVIKIVASLKNPTIALFLSMSLCAEWYLKVSLHYIFVFLYNLEF